MKFIFRLHCLHASRAINRNTSGNPASTVPQTRGMIDVTFLPIGLWSAVLKIQIDKSALTLHKLFASIDSIRHAF